MEFVHLIDPFTSLGRLALFPVFGDSHRTAKNTHAQVWCKWWFLRPRGQSPGDGLLAAAVSEGVALWETTKLRKRVFKGVNLSPHRNPLGRCCPYPTPQVRGWAGVRLGS